MPYKTLSDLPASITEHLPRHAQEIYLAAFNNAWDEYKDPKNRRDDSSREEVAHKVAWAAVKTSYEKRGDKWVAKKS
ncbi:MAG TPA: ChaB family protein [Gammaproteobacteria bacterium]